MDIMTVDETAAFLHKHPGTVRRLISANKLKARKISAGGSGVYVILRTDLLEFVVAGDQGHHSKQTKTRRPPVTSPLQEKLPIP
jgi:excisionase family DNA binding protein